MQDQGIRLQYINQYSTGAFDESAAEAATYDAASKQLIFTNANLETVSALDISSLADGSDLPEAVDLPTPAGYNPTSASVSDGLVAVALAKVRTTSALVLTSLLSKRCFANSAPQASKSRMHAWTCNLQFAGTAVLCTRTDTVACGDVHAVHRCRLELTPCCRAATLTLMV